MTPQRWQQVQELFGRALEHEGARRASFLDEACDGDPALRHEVDSLLAADARTDSMIDQPGFSLRLASSELVKEGCRIGPYEVLREIGRGGFGAVYLATRADQEFEQQVALKLIKRGMDTDELVRRFRLERQILADLDHPHIARLLDGGATQDGRPFFAMEYVDGKPIDEYCDEFQLSIRERLELFRKVCSAVEFAHRNLVLHRDIKPGNVLVDASGTPKLLDFGIAKLLQGGSGVQTAFVTTLGSRPMTLACASPEMVRGQPVTTSSDVYSLGVLLYRLLSGRHPYRIRGRAPDEIDRAICEEEPRRPSTAVVRTEAIPTVDGDACPPTPEAVSERRGTDPGKLRRRLSGDLDCIALRALRKQPHERYGSVVELSEDIRRHLEGLPVVARAGTFRYHAGKFVRRHRWRLTTALVLALVTAAGVTTRIKGVRQVEQAELSERLAAERAQEAFRQAEIRSDLLKNLFRASDLDHDESVTVRELLGRGEERIRANLEGEPLTTQLEIMGLLYGDLGLDDEATQLLEATLELRRGLYEGDHPLVALGLNNLAARHYRTGEYEAAAKLYQEALDMRRRLGQEGVDVVTAISNLASILMNQGEYVRAEKLYRRALAIRREAYGDEDPSVATSLRSLGILLYLRGDLERAEPLLREALEIRRRSFGEDDTRVAAAQSSLGRLLHAQGKYEEAGRLLNTVLVTRRRLLGEDHPHVALTKKDLAALVLAAIVPDPGNAATSEPAASVEALLTEALGVLRESKPEGSWEIADAEGLWGVYLAQQGRYEEAEPYLIESYTSLEKLRGTDAIYTRNAHQRLVDLYAAWGRPPPAWLRVSGKNHGLEKGGGRRPPPRDELRSLSPRLSTADAPRSTREGKLPRTARPLRGERSSARERGS